MNIFIRLITDHQPLRVIPDSNKREKKDLLTKKVDGFGHRPTQKKDQNTPTVFFLFLIGGRSYIYVRWYYSIPGSNVLYKLIRGFGMSNPLAMHLLCIKVTYAILFWKIERSAENLVSFRMTNEFWPIHINYIILFYVL